MFKIIPCLILKVLHGIKNEKKKSAEKERSLMELDYR